MSNAVYLSTGTRASLMGMRELSTQMASAQARLATGKRVANPTDNPASYFLASSLSARAAGLSGVLDTFGTSSTAIDAASSGIKAIQGLLRSAQDLATQALASTSTLVRVTGTNSTPLTTSSTIATTGGSSTRLRAGDTITVGDGTTTATYTAANNDTVQSFLNSINNNASLKVTASLNGSGQIQLQATGANNIVVGGSVNGGATTLLNATGLATGTTTFTASSTRQNLAQQFDAIRAQIDQLVQDAGVNGVNLLAGGSTAVTLNDSGSSTMTISGRNLAASALGIGSATAAAGGGFQTDEEIASMLSAINTAFTTLKSQATILGSGASVMSARKDFTSAMVDILKTGADQLTAADANEDGALLLALQTRQQIAASALSLSSQQDQATLRLFGLG